MPTPLTDDEARRLREIREDLFKLKDDPDSEEKRKDEERLWREAWGILKRFQE